MDRNRLGKPASSIAIVIVAIVVFSVFLVATAVFEEVTFGTHYVSSLYRTPIDWLIESIKGRAAGKLVDFRPTT